jgi:tRNA dimethylallyltransferase
VAVWALQRPRAELCARINRRVVEMFAAGLIAEVQTLQAGPKPLGPVPAQAVGYREVLDWLAGRPPRDEAELVARVQARTRQFAKRQMTWFRGLSEVRLWSPPSG